MGCGSSKAANAADGRVQSSTSQKSAQKSGRSFVTDISSKTKEGAYPFHDKTAVIEAPAKRERRAAYGAEVVKDQLRKKGKVGNAADNTEDEGEDQVSDSEDSDDDEASLARKNQYVKQYSRLASMEHQTEEELSIAHALQGSTVFAGIAPSLLCQVVHSMCMQAFSAGDTILSQGALVGEDDFMYLLQSGEVDIVISGGQVSSEEHKREGNITKIRKQPGWLFGDVALLFASARSASVVAATDVTVWSLDRRSFLKFVLHHAPGVRRLRFIRKLPLLKGLSDQTIIKVGEQVSEEVFEDGEALVRHGETGTKFYVIRYGKVRVMRPLPNGETAEICKLRRGQFVGERTLITGQLRSADCIAMGKVTAVGMSKRQFAEIDNPLLSWMLDYDAVASVLRLCQKPGAVPEEKMDTAVELFEREEAPQGRVILAQGATCNRLYIVRGGIVEAMQGDQKAPLRESGGFTFFGDDAMMSSSPMSVTVKVASETATLLSITRAGLTTLLDDAAQRSNLATRPIRQPTISHTDIEFVKAAFLKLPALRKHLSEASVQSLAELFELRTFDCGEVIAAAGGVADKLFVVRSGSCVLSQKPLILDKATGKVTFPAALPGQRLNPGAVQTQMTMTPGAIRRFSLVAIKKNTEILSVTRADASEVLQSYMGLYMALRESEAFTEASALAGADAAVSITTRIQASKSFGSVRYADITPGRIIGTGQFGQVRIVQHKVTAEPYALKCIHKAPITQLKQVDHTINERRLLEAVSSDFCVRLYGAFQDPTDLMLLQEWVGGGELFHHLDKEGCFDEPTACFYAANVVVAMSQLHAQDIVYRDLKPENLLIDSKGYIKMADFGFAKYIPNGKTFTICGTPDYQAPEVIKRKGTDKAADYWAIGVLIYEMLTGDPPFKSVTGDPWDTFRQALSGRFFCPPSLSDHAKDLIFGLLKLDPKERLGSGPKGAEDIKRHAWFSRLDWAALEAKTLPAPMIPKIKDPLDTSNFDDFDDIEEPQPLVGPDRNAAHWEGLWDWIDARPKRLDSSKKFTRALSRREQLAMGDEDQDEEDDLEDDDDEDS